MSKYQKLHKVTLQVPKPLQKWHHSLSPETDSSNVLFLTAVACMHSLHQKNNTFLCKCNTYNGQMTSSASISGFLFGNAADIYPDQVFSCFVRKTVQSASVGYKVSGFPAWIMLHLLKQRSAVLLESQNILLDSSAEPLHWEHRSDSLHTGIRKTAFYQRSTGTQFMASLLYFRSQLVAIHIFFVKKT